MLFVVMPVHNRKALTRGCLNSLKYQTVKDFTIVVVDDGSTDGTAEMIQNEFPDIKLLYGDGQFFWTKSVNLGIRYALEQKASYIMTINDDTIKDESYIEKMLFWADQQKDALLGAFAIDIHTKKAVYGGARINWKNRKTVSLLNKLPIEQQFGLHEVNHLPARGLLIPTAVFEKIGLFNEDQLPHSYADYDFTCRAHRNGCKLYCNYDAKIYIYPEENGDFKNRKNKSIKGYFYHLFGIKGEGNLRRFTTYVLNNCPPKYIPFVLVDGYARRLIGYLKR